MNLLEAVQSGSLEEVKRVADSDWTDYECLNTALANGNIEIAKFLLSQNSRVNKTTITNEFESSPLHKAVKLKNTDLVRLLLEKKASISAITNGKNTPLHLAFLDDHTEMVNLLLQHIDETSDLVNCKNDIGLSHLHIACTTENFTVIEKYLEANANIEDAVNNDSPKWAGYTAFHFAVAYRSRSALFHLLDASPKAEFMRQEDNDGYTPWTLACKRFVEYSIMMLIMSKYQGREERASERVDTMFDIFDIGAYECMEKPSAFHLVCMRDDPELVKIYLEHGAPVNINVGKRMKLCPLYSPLHFAVESKCKENVQVLLDNGANITHINGHMMTALHLAMYNDDLKQRDFAYVVAKYDKEELDEKKQDKGVKVKRKKASSKSKQSIVNLLYLKMENKEKNLKDKNGLGYFHIAVTQNDLELVKKMLDSKKVNVNSQVLANDRGFSLYMPLHFAVQYGYEEMTKLLIEHGADVNAVSSRGTPLQIAIRKNASTIIDLLLENPELKTDEATNKQPLMHTLVIAIMQNEFDYGPIRPQTFSGEIVLAVAKGMLLDRFDRMVELGFDVNATNSRGNTALHLAWHSSSCVNLLLHNGADVNLENDKGMTPFESILWDYVDRADPDKAEMYNHVKNLMALGVKVNPKNVAYCEVILGFEINEDEDEPLVLMQERRVAEVERMKRQKIDEKTTLYDFMNLEDKDTGMYARNKVLKRIVEHENEYTDYPEYEYLIKLQYRKSQKYAETKVTGKRSLDSESNESNISKRKRTE